VTATAPGGHGQALPLSIGRYLKPQCDLWLIYAKERYNEAMAAWEVAVSLLLGGLIVLFIGAALLDWPTVKSWLRERIHV
jgi:hypothetical protein